MCVATGACARSNIEVICSYAPSQSSAVAALSGAAGGAGATAGAVAAATGLTAVSHSSGALILTGSLGYVAGTLGPTASVIGAAPAIVLVGVAVGGTAVTLELVCATRNHPQQVAKVNDAALEFNKRFEVAMSKTRVATGELRKSIAPMAGEAALRVKSMASDVWEYVYRKSPAPAGNRTK